MYAFTEPGKNYIKNDEKGKPYRMQVTNSLMKKLPNSYDGTSTHLIKVCFLDIKLDFKHVKPGNYKLFIDETYENAQTRGQLKVKVTVGDKEIYNNEAFPNAGMIKDKNSIEHFICDTKRQDFDKNKHDKNGNIIVKVAIVGKYISW